MSVPICPDLKALYGDVYRIFYDPAAVTIAARRDPWMYMLRGKYGAIYPYSDSLLAVECDYHDVIAGKLTRLGLAIYHDGDGEKTFLFPLSKLSEVDKIILLKRKRKITDEQKAIGAAALAAWRAKNHNANG